MTSWTELPRPAVPSPAMNATDASRWYWCLEHDRAEPEREACRATTRLGPYASPEEARRWKDRVEARNDAWDEQDEDWGSA